MGRIIDMHSHIGDILYPDGGELIFRKGVKKRFVIEGLSHSVLIFSERRLRG